MAARLILLAKVFFGVIRGGLALVNILASTLFGCISAHRSPTPPRSAR